MFKKEKLSIEYCDTYGIDEDDIPMVSNAFCVGYDVATHGALARHTRLIELLEALAENCGPEEGQMWLDLRQIIDEARAW